MTLYGQRPTPPPTPNDTAKRDESKSFLGLNGTQIAAGALAASTSAVAASYLGAVGTVVGAGVGSVIATVSTALYQSSLKRSADRLQRVVPVLTRRERAAGEPTGPPPGSLPPARGTASVQGPHPDEAADALSGLSGGTVPLPADATRPLGPLGPTGPANGVTAPLPVTPPASLDLADTRWWHGLPWRRIAALSAVVFVLALAVVSVIELIDGRPLSAVLRGEQTSGTTIGGTRDAGPTPTPADTASPETSVTTDESPSTQETSAPPEETADPSPTDGTEQTAEPTTSPSGQGVPSPPPPVGPTQGG